MAWRIHIIMGTVIPAAGILLLSLSSLAGSIWLQFAIQKTPQLAKLDDIHGAPSLWLISSAVADVVISCCLVYGLVYWDLIDQEFQRLLGAFPDKKAIALLIHEGSD
ncbi:hypothetical protein EV360DRAFT_84109 [Lentinula raphanica]|nr:hypothetical protein EV360DRAFT_84109 [Lentinula raphanica]